MSLTTDEKTEIGLVAAIIALWLWRPKRKTGGVDVVPPGQTFPPDEWEGGGGSFGGGGASGTW